MPSFIFFFVLNGISGYWTETELPADHQDILLTDLKCGSKYQFYATAFNTVGRGPPSEVVRTRTDGIPPVAPDKHSLITSVNETTALVRPDAWHDGGCPIESFALRYRAQRKPGAWTVVDRNQNQIQEDTSPLILSNLVPGTWYQLQVTATNEAGSTDAEYSFATAISSDGSTRTILLDSIGDSGDNYAEIPFYLDVKVLIPAAVSLAVVIVLLIVACLVAGHKNRRHSCDTGNSSSDPYSGNRKKSQMARESVPLSDVEKSSLKKTLSTASAPRDDYYPVPYATTRISNAEQEQQQKEAARLHQVSSEEPLYATVKRTPRPPRSDIHIYHYPGEIHDLFIQEGEKELIVEDARASTSHWRQCSLGQKSDDFVSDLADCNRPSAQSYRYSQR